MFIGCSQRFSENNREHAYLLPLAKCLYLFGFISLLKSQSTIKEKSFDLSNLNPIGTFCQYRSHDFCKNLQKLAIIWVGGILDAQMAKIGNNLGWGNFWMHRWQKLVDISRKVKILICFPCGTHAEIVSISLFSSTTTISLLFSK